MLVLGAVNINKVSQQRAAMILNDIITVMLFFISVDNIVLNSLGLSYNHDPWEPNPFNAG